nr:NUDIX domain-containing protein [Corynebacterium sp. 13CS0277]
MLSALILVDAEGRIIHVRKHDTTSFIMPGGKREAGETPAETAVREIDEELDVRIPLDEIVHVGTFSAAAANEADTFVSCDVFALQHRLAEHPTPRAEIAEVRSFTAAELAAPAPAEDEGADIIAPLSRLVFRTLHEQGWQPPAPRA